MGVIETVILQSWQLPFNIDFCIRRQITALNRIKSHLTHSLSLSPTLSLQGRCNREKPPCKYFHPPQHLKDQLLINGRNHLALKNALMQQMGIAPGQQGVLPGQVQTVVRTRGGWCPTIIIMQCLCVCVVDYCMIPWSAIRLPLILGANKKVGARLICKLTLGTPTFMGSATPFLQPSTQSITIIAFDRKTIYFILYVLPRNCTLNYYLFVL